MPTQPRAIWRRWLPLAVLAAAAVAAWSSGLGDCLSFETLRTHREALKAAVADNFALAALAYVLVYAAAIAVSIPGGVILTVAGGFLFGLLPGTILTVLAATLGATAVFLIAKTALGDVLRAKAGGAVRRMEQGFRENALSYMLFLRLVPVFPFWLVNLVPALLGVPLRTYVLGTLVGIVPGTFVYTSVGSGLDAAFAAGQTPDLRLILKPEILLPLVGLGLLALLPAAVRRWRAKGHAPGE
jgi:uncharacterized membrane protein YdjX (TVP38/TMEM64 family)